MNRRASSAPAPYQVLLAKKLLPKNPNRCGCCATKATCGAAGGARCLAILRFGCGFASGLLSSAGLNCANDSRTRAFAVNSPATVGGGGLIAGILVAVKETNPKIRVYGVEPRGAASMRASRKRSRQMRLTFAA